MKTNKFFLLIALLIVTIAATSVVSEWSWSIKSSSPDTLRKMVGLPSLAVGNLNPAARNPGLEVLCASFYDVPGGYCSYFTQGVSAVNLTLACNVTEVTK
jgi:hypothetical protein